MLNGHCLCGAISVQIRVAVEPPTVCHCGMCRRWHGSPGAYVSAPAGTWRIEGENHVVRYSSSPQAERGFCGLCGSKLFWKARGSKSLDPALGLLDLPTGLAIGAHIWVAHKGDYYAIGDGVPCYAQSMSGAPIIQEPALPERATNPARTGRCLCGAIAFRLKNALREILTCHCGMCRRWHGHFPAYTSARRPDIELDGGASLCWYGSSGDAKRGFCGICGSSLFWAPEGEDRWSIVVGTLDAPTGLRNSLHIFAADKGDSYQIGDGVRQVPGSTVPDLVTF